MEPAIGAACFDRIGRLIVAARGDGKILRLTLA
jgi:hypothetical protein